MSDIVQPMTDSASVVSSQSPIPNPQSPVLQLLGVTKRFGGAVALSGVDFSLNPGEIHGLLGENGAGKSTLMKILSGVHSPDEGLIQLNGQVIRFSSPADAKARGIGMIYQELTVMPALTIAENVFLGRQPVTRGGVIDWRRMKRESKAMLAQIGIDLDVTARMRSLSLGAQQMVEIARVVYSGADVIVLDEPTSALSTPEAERLFALMRELRFQGKSLIFITHFLEDALAVSDRVTILKNSQLVATLPVAGLTKGRIIELMIGKDASALAEGYQQGRQLPAPIQTPRRLQLNRLTAHAGFSDVSFAINAGEILGIFGFLGAGMTEVARTLFGQTRAQSGTIMLDGEVVRPKNPLEGKNLGVAYLTENRRSTIFPRHEIYKNISLAHLGKLVPPFFRHPSELGLATELMRQTGVRPPNPRLRAGLLSGGNQQKVVLAKWLTQQPRLLILNEPTRGMDVGAKREVLDLLKALKEAGVAILLLSTEPETVIAESDRILVMSKGRITREFSNELVSKDLLMEYA